MSFTKKINVNDGSGRKFEEQTTAEMPLDATPQLGSFNAVTSDGVAKAIAGASGAVPAVNPGDAGKVLTAGFDGDTPTVSWEESASGVPEYSGADEGKVLGVITEGVEDTPALGWVEQQGGAVDQTYDSTSANAQSGVAVAEAIAAIPSTSYTAGDGIDITANEVSAKVGAGLVIADHSTTTTVTKTLSAPHEYENDPVTCICPASEIADALRSGAIDITTTMAFRNARNDVIHAFLCICLWDSDLRTPKNPYYDDNKGIVFNPEISLSGSTGNWTLPANTTIQTDTFNNLWYSNTTVQYVLEHIDEFCLCLICLDSNYERFWDGSYMQAPSSAAPGTVPTATTTYASAVTVTDALNVAEPVPVATGLDEGKVLGVTDSNGTLGWVGIASVDQTYDALSPNPQSGVAVAEAVGGVLPSSTSADENKVLTVNSSGTPVWAAAQGGGGSGMLPPIAANTVRCRFAAGYTPSMGTDGNVCVDAANNVWDITDNTGFEAKFLNNTNLLEVLGARLISSMSSHSCNTMFGGCTALTKVADFYLSSEGYAAYSAQSMFEDCSALRKVEFTRMDVGNAGSMFSGCSKLEEHSGLDSSSLTNATSMFYNCYALRVGYMGGVGYGLTMAHMYDGCRSLTQVLPEVTIPSSGGTDAIAYAFNGCGSLESLPKINAPSFVFSAVGLSGVFNGCSNAINGIKKAYDTLSGISSIDSTTDCFTGCGTNSYSGQQERAQIPAAWGGDAT